MNLSILNKETVTGYNKQQLNKLFSLHGDSRTTLLTAGQLVGDDVHAQFASITIPDKYMQ
jgi:hypothetical protein